MSAAGLAEATPISRGHAGVSCCGEPPGVVNGCPSPATEFLLSPGMVAADEHADLGWIILAFCPRHRAAVLGYVLPRLGPLAEDAIVAEIAALPKALRDVAGIDAAIDGLDENVVTNVFQPRPSASAG